MSEDGMGDIKRILVTGGHGQLGTELKRYASPEGWAVTGIDIDELNLCNTAAIAAMVAEGHDGQPWAAVISADAYNAVDKAESDIVTAWAVNAIAPAAFAESCARPVFRSSRSPLTMSLRVRAMVRGK